MGSQVDHIRGLNVTDRVKGRDLEKVRRRSNEAVLRGANVIRGPLPLILEPGWYYSLSI